MYWFCSGFWRFWDWWLYSWYISGESYFESWIN
jgi:Predicted hydrolases of the HAD superfamily